MRLDIYIEEHAIPLEIPDEVLEQGREFFERMDADMDQGWQMSREWIERPDRVQRCQIAADRLHTALVQNNERLTWLMAGYILTRLPGVTGLRIDTGGDMLGIEFIGGGW